MIIVNTSRTVKDEMAYEEKLRFTLGVWPFHRGQTIPDIEPFADVIVGSTSNVITVVEPIDKVVLSADGDRFDVIAKPHEELAPEFDALIGQRLTPDFAWKPGQGWPVKYVETEDFLTEHRAGPPEVTLAGYRLSVDPNGGAHLYLPRGGDVHIHAGA